MRVIPEPCKKDARQVYNHSRVPWQHDNELSLPATSPMNTIRTGQHVRGAVPHRHVIDKNIPERYFPPPNFDTAQAPRLPAAPTIFRTLYRHSTEWPRMTPATIEMLLYREINSNTLMDTYIYLQLKRES